MTGWTSLRSLSILASSRSSLLSVTRSISILSQKAQFKGVKTGGVFGLSGLQQPNDWNLIAKTCILRCEELAEEVRTWPNLEDPLLLQKFDELSNELCVVLDTAELCRNVHPDEGFCRSAEQAYLSVSGLIQNLNADFKLYEPLSELRNRIIRSSNNVENVQSQFSEEDTFMVNSLALDFERGGIALPKSEKQGLIKLQDDALRCGFEFMANANKMQEVTVPAYLSTVLPRRIRHLIKANPGENQAVFHVNGESIGDVLRSIPSSKDRRILYEASHEKISLHGLPVLDNLMEARRDTARALGEESFAEMQFNGRLASSYEDVNEFLLDLSRLVDKKVRHEMKELERYSPSTGDGLESWDLSYCLSQAKASKYNYSVDEVSQYFPISAVLDGMALVMKQTFGVSLREDTSVDCGGEVWHSTVKKYVLADGANGVLGHIFLDLHPRDDKSAQAAHFCIRCGRSNGASEPYQTPVVALVCRFNRVGSTGEMLLSFSEYETLWHEFGHAMHSLLSRTTYQHLSGTRVSTDLVEIPSHLFEHFATDPRVLSRVARHYLDGSPMPSRMMHELCGASRHDFAAIDVQHQALLASFDLLLHGRNAPIGDALSAYNGLKSSMSPQFSPETVASFASFQHLVTYGAGYYSYLFARIISAQLYDTYLKEDPFGRDAGDAIRYGLLVYGSAKPPGELLKGLLAGSKPDCAPFLNSLGTNDNSIEVGKEARLTLPVRY